jgi:hypothetical protein
LALGPIRTSRIDTAFVACDGDIWKYIWNQMPEEGPTLGVPTARGIVVCRGNYTASLVGGLLC